MEEANKMTDAQLDELFDLYDESYGGSSETYPMAKRWAHVFTKAGWVSPDQLEGRENFFIASIQAKADAELERRIRIKTMRDMVTAAYNSKFWTDEPDCSDSKFLIDKFDTWAEEKIANLASPIEEQ